MSRSPSPRSRDLLRPFTLAAPGALVHAWDRSPFLSPRRIHGRVSPVPVQWEAQAKLRFQLLFQAEVGRALGELQAAVMLFYLGRREGSGHPQELLATGPGLPRDQVGPGLGGSRAVPALLPRAFVTPPSPFNSPSLSLCHPSQSIHRSPRSLCRPLPVHSQSPPNPFTIPSQPLCHPSSPFSSPSQSLCHPLPASPPRLPLPPCLKMELLPRPQLPQSRRGCPGYLDRSGGPDPAHPRVHGVPCTPRPLWGWSRSSRCPPPSLSVLPGWVTRSPQGPQ